MLLIATNSNASMPKKETYFKNESLHSEELDFNI